MHKDMSNEYHLKVMQLIAKHPDISQRELAARMNVSVGKVNYCMKALVGKGLVKIQNFRNSQNKKAYVYLLTPEGAASKARLTLQYLKLRIKEYDALKEEIAQLQQDLVSAESADFCCEDV